MIHKKLCRWNYSFFMDTAFFYFYKGDKLICIEYWLDEETVSTGWQLYTINGELIEGECGALSEEEIEYYTEFCMNEISKEA